ncbi:hypothetical protein Cenrod_1630 [Candidatus Symbiobacter mobilis CR]|uniref:Uncharacterized protein n=1 Tax=Candidatus Symbiobacter mobilis CR TaxID=946483 RepID=U5N8R8_9BURK|nr:hypothetical protein Cenrod_1630 [Candidatus Symbiobacter mobilis CR]
MGAHDDNASFTGSGGCMFRVWCVVWIVLGGAGWL